MKGEHHCPGSLLAKMYMQEVFPSIKSAIMQDAEAVWVIRYHPQVSKESLNITKVSLDEHIKWFKKKYINSPQNYCFVLKKIDRVIGYARFDIQENKELLLSMAIHPEYQRKGYGSFMIQQSLSKLPQRSVITAEVKKDNLVSKKILTKYGFIYFGESGDVINLKKNYD